MFFNLLSLLPPNCKVKIKHWLNVSEMYTMMSEPQNDIKRIVVKCEKIEMYFE